MALLLSKPQQNVKQVDFKGRRSGGRGRRRGRGRGRISYIGAVRQLKSDFKALVSTLNVEDKYIDTIVAPTAFASTAAVLTLLNGTQLGNTANTRTGFSTKAVDLQLNLLLTQNSAAANTFVRIVLIRDEQPNSAVFLGNDLMIDSTNVLSLRYVPYIPRFHTYMDELICLTANNVHGAVISRTFRTSFHVQYNTSNAGTIADINKNSLYLYLQSNESANFASYSFFARFSYVDN